MLREEANCLTTTGAGASGLFRVLHIPIQRFGQSRIDVMRRVVAQQFPRLADVRVRMAHIAFLEIAIDRAQILSNAETAASAGCATIQKAGSSVVRREAAML